MKKIMLLAVLALLIVAAFAPAAQAVTTKRCVMGSPDGKGGVYGYQDFNVSGSYVYTNAFHYYGWRSATWLPNHLQTGQVTLGSYNRTRTDLVYDSSDNNFASGLNVKTAKGASSKWYFKIWTTAGYNHYVNLSPYPATIVTP